MVRAAMHVRASEGRALHGAGARGSQADRSSRTQPARCGGAGEDAAQAPAHPVDPGGARPSTIASASLPCFSAIAALRRSRFAAPAGAELGTSACSSSGRSGRGSSTVREMTLLATAWRSDVIRSSAFREARRVAAPSEPPRRLFDLRQAHDESRARPRCTAAMMSVPHWRRPKPFEQPSAGLARRSGEDRGMGGDAADRIRPSGRARRRRHVAGFALPARARPATSGGRPRAPSGLRTRVFRAAPGALGVEWHRFLGEVRTSISSLTQSLPPRFFRSASSAAEDVAQMGLTSRSPRHASARARAAARDQSVKRSGLRPAGGRVALDELVIRRCCHRNPAPWPPPGSVSKIGCGVVPVLVPRRSRCPGGRRETPSARPRFPISSKKNGLRSMPGAGVLDHDELPSALAHLHDAEQGMVGRLPQELGVDGDDLVLGEPGAGGGEVGSGGNQIHEQSMTRRTGVLPKALICQGC